MTGLTAVSLFAGIGGFDLACQWAGITVAAAAEIDPACRGVLARHFPRATLFGDVSEVTGDQLRAAGFVPGRGLMCGGFPCQDLSVAGRRAGLGGARSGLFWHIVRLAGELSPQWLILENVPGLLSAVCSCPGDDTCTGNGRAVRCGLAEPARIADGRSRAIAWHDNVPHAVKGGACPAGCLPAHGGAMGTVLGALGKLGYGFAYRVLDAQFFGIPQRRERVFIVGCLGDRAAPVQVLLEPEGSSGHPAAGRQTAPGIAGGPASRPDRGGGAGRVASTLQGGGQRGHRVDAEGAAGGHLIAYSLTAHHGRNDLEETWVAGPLRSHPRPGSATPGAVTVTHVLTAEGADASEDGTGRGTPLVPVFAPLTAGTPAGPRVNAAGRRMEDDWNLADDGQAVRRLTPRECERLQGFPDNWTRWLADGAGQSDSARYRQLGNAVAVPVAEWITRRLAAGASRAARSATRGRTAA